MADVGKIWYCKIGEATPIPDGADWPMRQAVTKAYKEITGKEPLFIFSGWGGQLDDAERTVVERQYDYETEGLGGT